MTVRVERTKQLGLEVFEIYVDTVLIATCLSEAGARTRVDVLKKKIQALKA